MSGTFIREMQSDIVQITVGQHSYLLHIKEGGHPRESFLGNRFLDDYKSILEVASFDKVVVEEKLQFMEKHKGTAWSHFRGIVSQAVIVNILHSKYMGIEIYLQIHRKVICRIDDYLRAGGFIAQADPLRYFIIGARCILLLQAVC